MTRGVLRCAFKASFFVFLSFVLLPSRSIGAVFVRVHSQRFIAQPIFDALILAVDQSVSGGALSLSLSQFSAQLSCSPTIIFPPTVENIESNFPRLLALPLCLAALRIAE